MEALVKGILAIGGTMVVLTLILGITWRYFLFYCEEEVRAIEWFYPWTIGAIKHFNKEIKYRHWLTTFLCTIVGIVDTIVTIPAFTSILLWEAISHVFKLIVKGIKNLIFVNSKEKEEEEEEKTNNSDLVLAYHTESGKLVSFHYNPKTNVTFISKGALK